MIHFQDYEEYMRFRRGLEREADGYPVEEDTGKRDREKNDRRTELVLEDNTIYEIDISCEKCLKQFWKARADKNGRSQ